MKEHLLNILKGMGISPHIVKGFSEVPREEFLAKRCSLSLVYEDIVLVSYDDGEEFSTSSQPSLMALFMEWVGIKEGMKVLEIGGGTGYNAAVMGKIVGKKGLVISVEYSSKICEFAQENLNRLGIENVVMKCGDGYVGAPEFSPFDAVVVTVGVDEIPHTWFEQLRERGMVVAPINLISSGRQPAFLFEKRKDYLVGHFKLDTRFIKASGMLGNLVERNRSKLKKNRSLEKVLPIPMVRAKNFLELIHLLTRRLTIIDGRFYYVGDEGFACFEEDSVLVYGNLDELVALFQEWKGCGYRSFEELVLHVGYGTPSHIYCTT